MSSPPPDPDATPRPLGVRVSAPKCVRCGKPVEARFRPFCSQRCADIDLGAWVTGAYRVATEEAPTEVDDAQSPQERDAAAKG
ncbi:MAG: DNA gyrase inhibitor YacG [Rhodospirillaceae bacterium]|nr:DNA gyrase inhibitor YacG [Rhodospirillaceae bacterium]